MERDSGVRGKVCEDETELTEEYKKGHVKGKREVPVLFEEADGVYIRLQGKDRKEEKQDKSEIMKDGEKPVRIVMR